MRRLLAALALTALVAACGDSTSPKNSPVGTWALTSFNGRSLPVMFDQSAGDTIFITGSTLNVNASGTFAEVISWREVSAGQDTTGTDSDGGTWTIQGATITFNAGQGTYTGTFQGSTITEVGQDTWVYSRQ